MYVYISVMCDVIIETGTLRAKPDILCYLHFVAS